MPTHHAAERLDPAVVDKVAACLFVPAQVVERDRACLLQLERSRLVLIRIHGKAWRHHSHNRALVDDVLNRRGARREAAQRKRPNLRHFDVAEQHEPVQCWVFFQESRTCGTGCMLVILN